MFAYWAAYNQLYRANLAYYLVMFALSLVVPEQDYLFTLYIAFFLLNGFFISKRKTFLMERQVISCKPVIIISVITLSFLWLPVVAQGVSPPREAIMFFNLMSGFATGYFPWERIAQLLIIVYVAYKSFEEALFEKFFTNGRKP